MPSPRRTNHAGLYLRGRARRDGPLWSPAGKSDVVPCFRDIRPASMLTRAPRGEFFANDSIRSPGAKPMRTFAPIALAALTLAACSAPRASAPQASVPPSQSPDNNLDRATLPPPNPDCGVWRDWNGRYTAMCGLSPAPASFFPRSQPASPAPALTAQAKIRSVAHVCAWDALDWDELYDDERKAFETLGWSADNWNAQISGATSSKDWSELTPKERNAAQALGYNAQNWEVPCPNDIPE